MHFLIPFFSNCHLQTNMLITYWSMKYVHVYKHAQTHTLTHMPVHTQRIIPGWLACCTQSKVNYARIMTQIIILEWKGEFTWFPIDTAVGIPFANACPLSMISLWVSLDTALLLVFSCHFRDTALGAVLQKRQKEAPDSGHRLKKDRFMASTVLQNSGRRFWAVTIYTYWLARCFKESRILLNFLEFLWILSFWETHDPWMDGPTVELRWKRKVKLIFLRENRCWWQNKRTIWTAQTVPTPCSW